MSVVLSMQYFRILNVYSWCALAVNGSIGSVRESRHGAPQVRRARPGEHFTPFVQHNTFLSPIDQGIVRS